MNIPIYQHFLFFFTYEMAWKVIGEVGYESNLF